MTDFVLIHGAYQGGWIWKLVSERLRAKGHNVLAPTLDGCAERAAGLRAGITTETHGQEIAKLLYFHDLKNAVLVGTSSGGMVMACAAEQARDRVGRLVFADALALLMGRRSSTSSSARRPPSTLRWRAGPPGKTRSGGSSPVSIRPFANGPPTA
jgi:pimeloyl-ACP methyl ester carboxylesterase